MSVLNQVAHLPGGHPKDGIVFCWLMFQGGPTQNEKVRAGFRWMRRFQTLGRSEFPSLAGRPMRGRSGPLPQSRRGSWALAGLWLSERIERLIPHSLHPSFSLEPPIFLSNLRGGKRGILEENGEGWVRKKQQRIQEPEFARMCASGLHHGRWTGRKHLEPDKQWAMCDADLDGNCFGVGGKPILNQNFN